MFVNEDVEELHGLLNMFQVPMFAAERPPGGDFRLLTVNRTYQNLTGLAHDAIHGRTVADLLPPEEVALVEQRYSACSDSGAPLSYRERLTILGRTSDWNTTLLPVVTPSGMQRIIGTAVVARMEDRPDGSRRVFDDILYFSTQSQFHLSNVSTHLDRIAEDAEHGFRAVDLKVLSGLCRAVDRALEDIRSLAEPRRDPGQATRTLIADGLHANGATATAPQSLRNLSSLLGRGH
ncbi:PAS domain-containing protein [Oceaniglobus roseus]|uniref:PAS domain-containing protein n=1 Tax=Oceaniglobus roseus TaxID=1737570 RepID=UPI00156200C6|nr:PAS domain-containing protein [Kandeliimicrobium roseum]